MPVSELLLSIPYKTYHMAFGNRQISMLASQDEAYDILWTLEEEYSFVPRAFVAAAPDVVLPCTFNTHIHTLEALACSMGNTYPPI
eukprot:6108276-Amphidinium_carterae.1